MFRRNHAIVALLALPALTVLTAGCEDDKKATPQVIFSGRIQQGSGNDCRDTGSLMEDIGDFGNLALEPPVASKAVADGESAGQGSASVTCSVVAAGADEFDVSGSIALSGATGGFFRIDGKFKTSGEQTQVHVIVSNRKTANGYEQKDRACIVRYGTSFQGVAAGRVWGEVTCPKAENTSDPSRACELIAEFRFENCGS